MEYAEEEEEPDQDDDHGLLEQRTEAAALLPNIPSPKNTDGQVCTPPAPLSGSHLRTSELGH